jgi:hypothetical protein
LEQAGRARDTGIMTAETSAFLNSLREIIEKIKAKADTGDNNATDEDTAYLKEKLLVIQAACTSYSKKAAKDVMGELRQKKWSQSTNELLNAVAEHLLHSEFEEATDIVQKYHENLVDSAG